MADFQNASLSMSRRAASEKLKKQIQGNQDLLHHFKKPWSVKFNKTLATKQLEGKKIEYYFESSILHKKRSTQPVYPTL